MMNNLPDNSRIVEILLVEDNPGDIRLTQEALKDAKVSNHLNIARDGEEALQFLRKEKTYANVVTPDIIFLDLNLPKLDGREVLEIIKSDRILQLIPVVILTSSDAERDIVQTYNLHANCYVVKPVDFKKFIDVIKSINDFWLTVVKFPPTQ
jgi:two-component system, chemotaxis family, response regulator Rcp1